MSEKQLKEAARMVDVPVVKHELGKATVHLNNAKEGHLNSGGQASLSAPWQPQRAPTFPLHLPSFPRRPAHVFKPK